MPWYYLQEFSLVYESVIFLSEKKDKKTPKAQHRGFVLSFKVSTQGVNHHQLKTLENLLPCSYIVPVLATVLAQSVEVSPMHVCYDTINAGE